MNHLFSWRQGTSLLGVAAVAVACSGTSSSETNPTTAAGSGGGSSTTSMAGSGGSSAGGAPTTSTTTSAGAMTSGGGNGGAPTTSGGGGATAGGGAGGAPTGGAGTAGAGGGTGGSGGGGSCPAQTKFTLSVHVVVDVTWPASTATNAGTGKIHLWNRAVLSANGLNLSGETTPCGTSLPEFGLSGAGMIVTGGSKVLIEVPNVVWDAPTIPKLASKGTISGWDAGSTIAFEPTVALVGLTMADPMGMW